MKNIIAYLQNTIKMVLTSPPPAPYIYIPPL